MDDANTQASSLLTPEFRYSMHKGQPLCHEDLFICWWYLLLVNLDLRASNFLESYHPLDCTTFPSTVLKLFRLCA